MGKKLVTPGVCPLCQSKLNPGAVACPSCGGAESDGWAQLGSWKFSLIGLAFIFLIAPGLVSLAFAPTTGILLLAAGIGGLWFVRSKLKKNVSWVPSGARSA